MGIKILFGMFFDGTGNNANDNNSQYSVQTSNIHDIESVGQPVELYFEVSNERTYTDSHNETSCYTNIFWLYKMYKVNLTSQSIYQQPIYIEGVGTETNQKNNIVGQALGILSTGVVAKADRAVEYLSSSIHNIIDEIVSEHDNCKIKIDSIQFDIFGFSRGAASARILANRIQSRDVSILKVINGGVSKFLFSGELKISTRFIGLFDTVSSVGTPGNWFNPHCPDFGEINTILRPGVAEKVFHIIADNEYRYNFPLNSVAPAWPELALPGSHSDIGGGYMPVFTENLFLTRPTVETIPLNTPSEKSRQYKKLVEKLKNLKSESNIAPILNVHAAQIETWYDSRMPLDRFGQMQKRNFAAITLRNRSIKNDWSKVVLQVMIFAAKKAGVILQDYKSLTIPEDLSFFREKAIAMCEAVMSGRQPMVFSQRELEILAVNYIHLSASWGQIPFGPDGIIQGGSRPFKIFSFINRPDKEWKRTIYNMDNKKILILKH